MSEIEMLDSYVDMDRAETHDVPFGSLPVSVFTDAGLRDVVERYYEPNSFIGKRSRESKLWALLGRFQLPTGYTATWTEEHRRHWVPPLVHVRIVFSYPLHTSWELVGNIPANAIGRVFGLAYDMYREIYRLDDHAWGKPAPRVHPNMGNRAKGKHVWGHDMSDLVFEGLLFEPHKDAEPLEAEKSYPTPPVLGTFGFLVGS